MATDFEYLRYVDARPLRGHIRLKPLLKSAPLTHPHSAKQNFLLHENNSRLPWWEHSGDYTLKQTDPDENPFWETETPRRSTKTLTRRCRTVMDDVFEFLSEASRNVKLFGMAWTAIGGAYYQSDSHPCVYLTTMKKKALAAKY